MATLTIPWQDGNGSVILTYTGEGDGVVTVRSTTDNKGDDRQMVLTLKTADGSKQVQVTISQPTGMQLFITADPYIFCDKDGKQFRVQPPNE